MTKLFNVEPRVGVRGETSKFADDGVTLSYDEGKSYGSLRRSTRTVSWATCLGTYGNNSCIFNEV